MSFTMIVICSLATYRLYRLIAVEEGPFRLAQRLRNVADPDQRTWVGRGLACVWCLSFWIAPVTLYAVRYDIGLVVVGGLAISALVGLLVQCGGIVASYAERLLRARR